MRNLKYGIVLLGSSLLGVACGWSQSVPANRQTQPHVEIAVTYDTLRANVVPGQSFWMQGGSVQFHGQFWRGLGVVADVAGLHAADMAKTNVGLDLVTATFGPRYTLVPRNGRTGVYGQALIGEANGINSFFPGPNGVSTTASGMALQLGGGANIRWTRHIAVRAFEADWLRTQLPNGTTNAQSSLRLGTGIVLRY